MPTRRTMALIILTVVLMKGPLNLLSMSAQRVAQDPDESGWKNTVARSVIWVTGS